MPEICDVRTVIEPPFVEVVDAVGGAQKGNGNRVGKQCGRKRKEDGALPSNKFKKPTRGAGSFLDYQAVVKVAVVVATAATIGVVDANANANADAYDTCSHVDALLVAFDDAAYIAADDANANANMLNVARHLVGAYANVAAANEVVVA